MSWSSAVDAWVSWLMGCGMARTSVRLRRYQLLRLGADVGGRPGTITAARLGRWLARQEWGRETRRSEIAGLRSFFEWTVRAGVRADDPTEDLPVLRPLPGVPRPAAEQFVRLALHSPAARVRLMVQLAAWHGLRRIEISRVATTDVVAAARGWSLVVHGKGGKDRIVPLVDVTAAALRRCPAGWVFPNGRGTHLSEGHVGVLITRELPAGVTPHMLRHRFATVVYRKTLDIRNLQLLLGHASVATTQRYAEPDDQMLRGMIAAAAA